MWYPLCMLVGVIVGAGGVWAIVERRRKINAEQAEQNRRRESEIQAAESRLSAESRTLEQSRQAFEAWATPLQGFERENAILKQDLLNIDTVVRKLEADRATQAESQRVLDERSEQLAAKYLADVERAVMNSVTANNYAACKQKLLKAIEWCREIGFEIDRAKEESLLANLKADFELAVRAQVEREEQARIKARIREEQAREREAQREIERCAREQEAIRLALDRALAEKDKLHDSQVDSLRAKLAEAEAKCQRAISQAQITKAGYIYIISNLGSFGENIFKLGMTRRLDPLDRVRELSDASVPFSFDVHAMISSNDAPSLEAELHRALSHCRVNRVNPRKEFFRTTLDEIAAIVRKNHGEIAYVADVEALEYRQSLTMSDEDQHAIDEAFEHAEKSLGLAGDED